MLRIRARRSAARSCQLRPRASRNTPPMPSFASSSYTASSTIVRAAHSTHLTNDTRGGGGDGGGSNSSGGGNEGPCLQSQTRTENRGERKENMRGEGEKEKEKTQRGSKAMRRRLCGNAGKQTESRAERSQTSESVREEERREEKRTLSAEL